MNNTPTPRTDAIQDELLNCDTYTAWLQVSQHARQLERELNEVQAERDQLKTVLDGFSSYHVFETKTI